MSILEPPRCLFHYRDELRKHAEESDNEKEKSHIHLCLQYMEKTLHREIKILKASVLPELEFGDLWIAFKPGCLVYSTIDGLGYLSRLRSIFEQEDDDDEILAWELDTEFVVHSGEKIGNMYTLPTIKRYTGCKPICELEVCPLHLYYDKEKLRCELLRRGRKYLSLWGIRHCSYDGLVLMGGTRREKVRTSR